MKIRITGKGANRALIDPLTGQKVFLSDKNAQCSQRAPTGLREAIL